MYYGIVCVPASIDPLVAYLETSLPRSTIGSTRAFPTLKVQIEISFNLNKIYSAEYMSDGESNAY